LENFQVLSNPENILRRGRYRDSEGLHQTIKKVEWDIENLHFNTAVSAMMIFLNLATKKAK